MFLKYLQLKWMLQVDLISYYTHLKILTCYYMQQNIFLMKNKTLEGCITTLGRERSCKPSSVAGILFKRKSSITGSIFQIARILYNMAANLAASMRKGHTFGLNMAAEDKENEGKEINYSILCLFRRKSNFPQLKN